MDKCREEFEIFWTARCCGLGIECVLTCLINGDYCDIKAYYAWIGWKERQESMKPIKLPEETDTSTCKSIEKEILHDGINYGIQQCREVIKQAGYKVE